MNITIRPSLILEFIGSREEHFSKIIIYKLISNGAIHYPICLSRVVRSRVLDRIFFFTARNHPPPIEQNPPPGRNQEDHPPPEETRKTPPPPEETRKTSPPRAVHAGRYAQQAGGTHLTGMHTCFLLIFPTFLFLFSMVLF